MLSTPLENADFRQVSHLIREGLPLDPFFSLTKSSIPVRVVLRHRKLRRGYCIKSEAGEIVGVIIVGPSISMVEAVTVAFCHLLRNPLRFCLSISVALDLSLAILALKREGRRDVTEILTLVVSSSHRRKGIGRTLLATVNDENLVARTLRSAPDALATYASNGFHVEFENRGRVYFRRNSSRIEAK